MNRLGLSTSSGRTGGLVIGADGSMSAGTGIGAALAVAVVADRCADDRPLVADLTDRPAGSVAVAAPLAAAAVARRGRRRVGFEPEQVSEAR